METVLCFDSGIGGLAYLHYLRHLPIRWVYLADNAYFPFGEQPQNKLRERICKVIALALSHYPCRLVLLLCNTATVLALDELRCRFPQQQFIGTVPAIKPAAEASQQRKIAMLASRSTSQADYVTVLHKQFAIDCELKAINAASLIEFIEQQWAGGSSTKKATEQAIAPFIQPNTRYGCRPSGLGLYPLCACQKPIALPTTSAWKYPISRFGCRCLPPPAKLVGK